MAQLLQFAAATARQFPATTGSNAASLDLLSLMRKLERIGRINPKALKAIDRYADAVLVASTSADATQDS